jgi:hypothetical protein
MKTITTTILALVLLASTTGAQSKSGTGVGTWIEGTPRSLPPATKPEKTAKPLTTDGLAITLLHLAERAEG